MAAAWGGKPAQQQQEQLQDQQQLQKQHQPQKPQQQPQLQRAGAQASPNIHVYHDTEPRAFTLPCKVVTAYRSLPGGHPPTQLAGYEGGSADPTRPTRTKSRESRCRTPRQNVRHSPIRQRTAPVGFLDQASSQCLSRSSNLESVESKCKASIAASMVSKGNEESLQHRGMSLEAPSNSSLVGIDCVQDGISQSKQDARKVAASEVQAWREAFNRSAQLVRVAQPLVGDLQDGPKAQTERRGDAGWTSKSANSYNGAPSVSEALVEGSVSKQAEVDSILAGLQRRLEDHEQRMQAKYAEVSERWETRFAALEGTTKSRLASFMSLAEVLEGAVQRVVCGEKDLDLLSCRIGRLEDRTTCKITACQNDVACLAREFANDRAERLSWWPAQGCQDSSEEACGTGGGEALQLMQSNLDRLERELREERTLRLQLALQVQNGRCDLERLRVLLDTTNDHLSRLVREHTSATGSSSSGAGNLPPECHGSLGLQLECLRREIQREVAGSAPSGSSWPSPGPGETSQTPWDTPVHWTF